MSSPRSRREFLTASALTGLALPAAAHASIDAPKPAPPTMAPPPAAAPPVLRKRKLGRTGPEVAEVAFGCMITSDQSVIVRAADLGVNLFDTARGYQGGNNERLVGAALKGRLTAENVISVSQCRPRKDSWMLPVVICREGEVDAYGRENNHMKNTLWTVVVVIAVFLGFMIGYSFPPFLEIGFAVGKGKTAPPTKIDTKMEDYYKNLYKDE